MKLVSFLGFLCESSNFPGHRYARMLPGKGYQNLSYTCRKHGGIFFFTPFLLILQGSNL